MSQASYFMINVALLAFLSLFFLILENKHVTSTKPENRPLSIPSLWVQPRTLPPPSKSFLSPLILPPSSSLPSTSLSLKLSKRISNSQSDKEFPVRSDMMIETNEEGPSSDNESLRFKTRIISGCSALLSAMGSLVIIFTSLRKEFFKSVALRLIFFLSVADLLASSAYLIHFIGLDSETRPHGNAWCTASAFIMTAFEMSSVIWSSSICLHLLVSILYPKSHQRRSQQNHPSSDTLASIKKQKTFKKSTLSQLIKICSMKITRMEPLYHFLSWGYPILWSSIVYFFQRFGRTDTWCWILKDGEDPSDPGSYDPFSLQNYFGWRFFSFMPIYVLMFFNISVYIIVIISLRCMLRRSSYSQVFSNEDRKKELKAMFRLSLFIVAFIITWILPFANRISEIVLSGEGGVTFLEIGQAVTNPLQGFLNMIVYGCTQRFLLQCSCLCRRVCCCSTCCLLEDELISRKNAKHEGKSNYKLTDDYDTQNRRSFLTLLTLCCLKRRNSENHKDMYFVSSDEEDENGDSNVKNRKSERNLDDGAQSFSESAISSPPYSKNGDLQSNEHSTTETRGIMTTPIHPFGQQLQHSNYGSIVDPRNQTQQTFNYQSHFASQSSFHHNYYNSSDDEDDEKMNGRADTTERAHHHKKSVHSFMIRDKHSSSALSYNSANSHGSEGSDMIRQQRGSHYQQLHDSGSIAENSRDDDVSNYSEYGEQFGNITPQSNIKTAAYVTTDKGNIVRILIENQNRNNKTSSFYE